MYRSVELDSQAHVQPWQARFWSSPTIGSLTKTRQVGLPREFCSQRLKQSYRARHICGSAALRSWERRRKCLVLGAGTVDQKDTGATKFISTAYIIIRFV
jgi:hypothetical protein